MSRRHINEVSQEFMWRAASAQRKRLKDENYLKSISAYDYIKQLKRASDFQDYADEIVDKINSGNINPELPKSELPAAVRNVQPENDNQGEATAAGEGPSNVGAPVPAIDVKSRKQEIKHAPAELKFQKHPNPKVNVTDDWENLKRGKYVVTYISNLDDDITSVWVESNSKKNAVNEVIREFWDVKEVVAVVIMDAYDENDYHHKGGTASGSASAPGTSVPPVVIDPEDYPTDRDLANACASIVTGGEFNNYNELVADMKDDTATEKSAKGDIYAGETEEGEQWFGNKSSVRMICESEDYDWMQPTGTAQKDNYKVEIVTEVNPNGQDNIITGYVSPEMMRLALSKGIVHIVFTKKSDGNERQAFATTNQEVLEDNKAIPSGDNNRQFANNHIRFFDMTKHAWRSFLMENLTMIYDESY